MMRSSRLLRWIVALTAVAAVSAGTNSSASNDVAVMLDDTVPELLSRYRVPGAAVAAVENGAVTTLRAYGVADEQTRQAIGADTVFQVGSISKTFTAWGVLHLVDRGKIDLDTPVQRYLKRWRLPPSPFDHGEVTVRRVLSHTAGLSVVSYPGTHPDEQLPTLVESLSGHGSNGSEVRVTAEPGRRHAYSGGGYTLMQLLVEDVTGQRFEDFMADAVLDPLGMINSSFRWEHDLRPLTATGHESSGRLLPNYLYTEAAAGGLYTTAEDLARFVAAVAGRSGGAISDASLAAALSQQSNTGGPFGGHGLGVTVSELDSGDRLVGHNGSNRGWTASWVAAPTRGAGLVVLTNSTSGVLLHTDLTCAWSKRVTGDAAQICTATSSARSFVAAATVLGAVYLGARTAFMVARARRGPRQWPRLSRRHSLRVAAWLVAAGTWIAFWHSLLGPFVMHSLGLWSVPAIAPARGMPPAFTPASSALVLALAARALAARIERPDRERRRRPGRVLAATTAVSILWVLAVFTDILSRVILRTAGPQPASVLPPMITIAVLFLVVGAGAFRYAHHQRIGPQP